MKSKPIRPLIAHPFHPARRLVVLLAALAIWTTVSIHAQPTGVGAGATPLSSGENSSRTQIRIRNDSTTPFKEVVVGGKSYGDIEPGGSTGHQLWVTAYRSTSVSLRTGTTPVTLRPTDLVNGSPLGPGYFTYVLRIQNGRLILRAENDELSARIQAWLSGREFRGQTDFSGVTDPSATLRFQGGGSKLRAFIQYVSGTPPARYEEECSVSVGVDEEIELRGVTYRVITGPNGPFNLDTIRLRLNDDGSISGTFIDDAFQAGSFRFAPVAAAASK